MKNGIRVALCLLMAAAAATAAGFTLAELAEPEAAGYGDAAGSMYVLGAAEGQVAIFTGGDAGLPPELTGISLSSLREGDRELLARGLPVDSREDLARLLEDLGS